MKSGSIILTAILCLHFNLFAGDGGHVIPSTLQSAIVYRNAAELVHIAKANLQKGNNDLIIEDISNNIDSNSIQINCNESLTILSVQFSKEYLKPEIKPLAEKKIEDSINIVSKAISKFDVVIRSDNESLDLLKANREIRGSSNGLSVSELVKMMDYFKQKSLELQNEIDDLREKESKLYEQLGILKNQLTEEERKNTKTSGRLLLQVLSPTAGTYDLTISYLTPNAYWDPSYDFRVDNITKPVKLLYKATLVQTSGIDWKQVKLTLSTSVPNQNDNAPLLKTWFLTYVDPVAQLDKSLNNFLAGSAARAQLNEVVVTGYATQLRGTRSIADIVEPIYVVDGKQMSNEEFKKIDSRTIKNISVLKGNNATEIYGSNAANGVVVVTLKDELGDYVSVNDNQLNVTFDIDLPYDIASNGKEQNLVLKEYDVPAAYKYYSVPKLDADSYLLGEVSDWGKLNLLPGEANIIFEGTYIGKTYIDPNSTEDTLNLTLGRDKRVVIKKEKLKDFSSVKVFGSSKKQMFTYEITIRNNKKEKIQLELKDQYPVSSNKEIESELTEESGASVNGETGILTWKLELAPGEIKKLRISYSVKYPKDKTININ